MKEVYRSGDSRLSMNQPSPLHPDIRGVIKKFEALELHAARAGREVMYALSKVATDSRTPDITQLASEIEAAIDAVLTVMPAYAPPLNVMHRIMTCVERAVAAGQTASELRAAIQRESEEFHLWSSYARDRLADFGTELIAPRMTIFTFTLSETVLGTLREARRQGRIFVVLVTESRPNNDGLVTAAELSKAGIPVAVSIDACLRDLISRADLMMVGAEAIMADGSAICKVGTYPSALVAQTFGVPVYVVVDSMKFNVTSVLGLPMKLDPILSDDIHTVDNGGKMRVVGHLFDRMPPELIRGIVTEKGILSPLACGDVMAEMPISTTLSAKLPAWITAQR